MITAIIFFLLMLCIVVLIIYINILYGVLKRENSQFNAMKRNYLFLNEWMDKKRRNPSRIVNLLSKKGYGRIAIYGAGEMGIQLYKDLCNSGIIIECFIDRSKSECGIDIPIYTLDDQLPEVDAVIVSVVHSWKIIEDSIVKKYQGDILFLEELV